MHRIVAADPLDPSGLDLLRERGAQVIEALDASSLADALPEAEALLVRSRTRVDADLMETAPRLRVVGRAGVGVDNVDLEEATERGVLVFNVPSANLLSAAEHTFALLLALARRVTRADEAMKRGRWDRKAFLGTELHGKTLGIIGFGRIGRRVGDRARAFAMDVLAHDPFLDPSVVRRRDVEAVSLEELLRRSDVVTLHVPGTPETRELLGSNEIRRMKPGALLLNCARGGLVDERALLEALDEGHLGGAGLDVFAEEPPGPSGLVAHSRVVATPHLGAQTQEAQRRVSVEAAKRVLSALEGAFPSSAVNLPFTWDGRRSRGPLILAEQLGRLAAVLIDERVSRVEVLLRGFDEAMLRPVSVAAARGVLRGVLGEGVGYVNVEHVAESRGVELVRSVGRPSSEYPQLIALDVRGPRGGIELAGTLFDESRPRVVRFGSIPLEFSPEGRVLVLRTDDLPGVVGAVGTLLGDARLNIADVHLARKDGEADAWTVLRLDQAPSVDVLERLRALPFVRTVCSADLGAPWSGGAAASLPERIEVAQSP